MSMSRSRYLALVMALSIGITAVVLAALLSAGSGRSDTVTTIKNAKTWMYQLQGLESPGALQKLAASDYDLLVLEPTNTIKGAEGFDAAGMVSQMKRSRPDRLVLAYLDIGEAEDYRTYWKGSWQKPRGSLRGRPSFMLSEDPDGWSGNYPVAYWDHRWKKVMITGRGSPLQKAIDAGFDGVYLDWVEGYDDDRVRHEAGKRKVDSAKSMVAFIRDLRSHAHKQNPEFLVVAQNAPYLIDTTGYLGQIDAAGFESTWYSGKGDASWDSPGAGDIKRQRSGGRYTTSSLLRTFDRYIQAGIPVFTIDYSRSRKRANSVYWASYAHGLKPLVTRVSLSRMTETPPP